MEKRTTKKRRASISPKRILSKLEANSREFHKLGVTRIGLFGSHLKKNAGKKSDLDFVVRFERPSFDKYMELKFMLERMFGKKIDLVMEESLKPALSYVRGEAAYAAGI